MTFTSLDSPLETRVSAVTNDPCTAKNQTAPCDLVNPLAAANIKVFLRAFNVDNINTLQGCYVLLDISGYQPLPLAAEAALATDNPKARLLQLAVWSLERNTANSPHYVECEIRVKDREKYPGLADMKLPAYLNPVIPPCREHTYAGKKRATALNNEGMEHYRAKDWKKAEALFRQAAVQDCSYFIARTNLASVLALQKNYEQAAAVLWRAMQLDRERTLQKLATDPDYHGLKQYANFYAANSPVGLAYRHYCYTPVKPVDVDPGLPTLLENSSLKHYASRYEVATRYSFETDFNANGIPDRVYPLVLQHLHALLVVFDEKQLDYKQCTSTPLYPQDLSRAFKADPCNIKITAESDRNNKRWLRVKTDYISVVREVCQ